MALHTLISVKGAKKRKKLVGRGSGSGHGKTSTRGHKGQRSRSGRDFYLGFEGGQSPLIRRIPKRGFNHRKKNAYLIVNTGSLSRFPKDSIVDAALLFKSGLIEDAVGMIKILGDGELSHSLTVKAHKFSKAAEERIKKAGGTITVIELNPKK